MAKSIGRIARLAVASLTLVTSLAAATIAAEARTRHRAHAAAAEAVAPRPAPPQGVVGYFGPGAYGPFGYGALGPFGPGYGYGWYHRPRGDLGFALLGALNGGGFRGFVECGNYYARYPGACGF